MEIYEYGDHETDIILIQPVDEHDMQGMENEFQYIRDNVTCDFKMIAVKIENWNKDLSPWNAPAVFGKENFGSGAEDTLKEIEKLCDDTSKTYYLGGYSLAGLFALWGAYQNDIFAAVVAASPSVWFPGFIEYMRSHEIMTDKVYLSLGDKEEKTKNPVMASVGNKIREAYAILEEHNVSCVLEWNPGNHFKNADIRTAKGFLWALQNK